MAGEGHHVDAELFHIDGDGSKSLHRVTVKENLLFVANPGNLFDGLNRTDLIISHHNRNENGILTNGCSDILRIHPSQLIDIEISNVEALSFQPLHAVQNGMMLNF